MIMAKKHITFLIIAAYIPGGNTETSAQQDISKITCFPTERHLYYGKNSSAETSNIERFFNELKTSLLIS